MKLCKSLLTMILLVSCTWIWADQASPVPMLEKTANDIIAVLKANKGNLKNNPSIIHRAVKAHLLPNVDVSGMSRSVLGREAWLKASAHEKDEFARAFTELVIRTYANPLAEYQDETIKFLPIRGSLNGQFVRVNSIIIRSSGQNIPLSYSLVSKNGNWKIYDLSVEGVSLLQSFRSQFSEALRHSSMQEIIKQLRQSSKKAA